MKVGVLGTADSWYVDQLCAAGRYSGHVVVPLIFSEMRADTDQGTLRMTCGDTDLSTLDALVVRTMPPGSLERVITRMDLLNGLADSGVPVINHPKAIECAVDKWLTTQKLVQAGVPVPRTAVCEDVDSAMQLLESLGGDILVKPLFGSEGRGILRVDSVDLGWRIFRSLERIGSVFYLQKFIPDAGEDFRILLLDGHIVGSMKRTAPQGDFRTNAAQSGTCTPWTPSDDAADLALKAAEITDCVFCGIDLIYDQDRRLNVLEVNAVPGWKALQSTCQVNVPAILFRWLESRF